MTDLNQNGDVLTPSKDEARAAAERLVANALNTNDDFIKEAIAAGERDTACVACGHDPYANTQSPFQQFLSAFLTPTGLRYLANVLAGIAYVIANSYLLPDGAWDNLTAGVHSAVLLLPSIAMFIALWLVLFSASALEGTSNLLMMIEKDKLYFIWSVLVGGSFLALMLVVIAVEVTSWFASFGIGGVS